MSGTAVPPTRPRASRQVPSRPSLCTRLGAAGWSRRGIGPGRSSKFRGRKSIATHPRRDATRAGSHRQRACPGRGGLRGGGTRRSLGRRGPLLGSRVRGPRSDGEYRLPVSSGAGSSPSSGSPPVSFEPQDGFGNRTRASPPAHAGDPGGAGDRARVVGSLWHVHAHGRPTTKGSAGTSWLFGRRTPRPRLNQSFLRLPRTGLWQGSSTAEPGTTNIAPGARTRGSLLSVGLVLCSDVVKRACDEDRCRILNA
jgi:hypothetical protein